ncbi:ABC transporter ATP-binding protein [Mycoplasmopsis ciconiae]|uniref:ABC transporter ATP-binding protein n=1 Tax=Mycoplasmopsis ciconiae TaxID=561067 RepID=A0ABU7MKZ0_9BACT|nr:ABC transporter ATP-binding protein [Mycoplasmopsis ciconiae]
MKKNKKTPSAFSKLIKYIWNTSPFLFSLIILGTIISSAVMAGAQSFLGLVLFNKFLVPFLAIPNAVFDWAGFTLAVSILGAMYILGVISQLISSRLSVNLTFKTIKNIQDDLYSHIQTLPLKYFDTNLKGDINSLFNNDIKTLRTLISESIPQMFNSLTTIIVSLGLMLYFSWFMTLIAIFLVALLLVLGQILGKNNKKYFFKRQELMAKLNGHVNEMINGVKVIKLFNYEQAIFDKYEKVSDEFYKYDFKAKLNANILFPIMINMGNLYYGLLAIIGGALVIFSNDLPSWLISTLNIGVLVSFLQYARNFSNPIGQIAQQFNTIFMGIAGSKRIFDTLEQQPETNSGTIQIIDTQKVDSLLLEDIKKQINQPNQFVYKIVQNNETIYKNAFGNVEFRNVNFGYTRDKLILKDINLNIKAGTKVAFVGATGAGKTTITNLINRFYDVTSGEILIDGINVNDIDKVSLRKSLGLVLQDTSLFTKTIKENISYGKEQAEMAEIANAANLSNANRFIDLMNDGFESVLENSGDNLSQGQKQLLSIARVSLLNPLILILDEATSTIDTNTEKHIQEAMYNLMQNRTSFVIAHRLSTILDCDLIVVMDQGRIIEMGNHQELMQKGAQYFKLFTGAIELD